MRHNQFKFNGILFWAKNEDWGQKAAIADKKVLFTEETAAKSKEFKLERVDFHIDAYIYGSDTLSKVAKLYRAFATKKTGILEHPDLGRIRVEFAAGGFRFKHSQKYLNYREMTLDFRVAKDAALDIQIVDVEELKDEQLDEEIFEAEQSFLEKFNQNFTLDGFPNLVKVQTFKNLTSISAKLSKLTLNNLVSAIVDPLKTSWDILMTSVGGIGSFFQSYLDFGGSNKNKYHAYMDLAKFEPELNESETSGHEQIAKNNEAIIGLIQQTAFAKAAELSKAEDVFDNKSEVNKAIEDFISVSASVALANNDQAIQNTVLNLGNLTVAVLLTVKAANTRTITAKKRLPAAVICYDENCDEAAFLKNNHIRHPLFVEAGVPLEVLENAGN